jgi:hypothetical protein
MSLRSNAVRIAVVGAVAAAITGIAAAPSQAGIYTWHKQGTYASNAACTAAGADLVRSTDADAYRCSGTAGTDLYLGYIW